MAMEFTAMLREQFMLVIGKRMLSKVKALKPGQKEANMLVNTKTERNKAMALTTGQTGLLTKVTG